MTDYAAAPAQPIVQGLVTFDANDNPVFFGKGISAIARMTGQPAGCFQLTLDGGLPGNAGAVEPVPNNGLFNPPIPPNPDVRTAITIRGTGAPPGTAITNIAVQYGNLAPLPGIGNTTIFVTFAVGGAFTDPEVGFEIMSWVGIGSSQLLPFVSV